MCLDGTDALTHHMGMTTTIPATKDEAVAALIEIDVAKWGESEREASRKVRSVLTYGLALNALANEAELSGTPNRPLRAAAKAALTKLDRASLRKGG